MYRNYTDIFDSTPNLIGWLSWCWDRSYDPDLALNFVADSVFDPITEMTRPAYLYLIKSIETETTMTQVKISTSTRKTGTETVARSPIPGFPIEAVLTGLLADAAALMQIRRRRRASCSFSGVHWERCTFPRILASDRNLERWKANWGNKMFRDKMAANIIAAAHAHIKDKDSWSSVCPYHQESIHPLSNVVYATSCFNSSARILSSTIFKCFVWPPEDQIHGFG